MKELFNRALKTLSKLGRAMLIPITAMPVAGIMARLGAADILAIPFVESAGWAVFGILDVLFAFGAVTAYVKTKDKIPSIIAAIVSVFVLRDTLAALNPDINMGIFGGIMVGCYTAWIHNRASYWKTPQMFSFFTGDKFSITLAPLFTVLFGWLMSFVWPVLQSGLDSFAIWLGGMGAIGIFIFGFLNRLLIPVGLHHVLNSYIYYGLGSFTMPNGDVVTGEMTRFVSGDPTAGFFLSMFFVMMMFGLPGAALAIYKTAKKKNRAKVGGLVGSSAATSFVTGITEPMEFSFMFVAPQLYVAHAVLTGLAGVACYLFGVRIGFVSGGNIIDLVVNWNIGSNVILIIPIGIVFFALYFIVFKFLIEHFDLKTPGREDDAELGEEVTEEELNAELKTTNYAYLAKKLLQCCGGTENVEDATHCMSRLRLELRHADQVDVEKIKQTGVMGVVCPSPTSIQIVIGRDIAKVYDEFVKLL